tara:strand:- start:449 stop:1060 length:612 start_codon:yes stop_codon:yes gene_type:complete
MKIYFDGDSWTRGNEIDEERRFSHRFSGLVSKKLNAVETNLSRGGASNNRIARQLLTETDISRYDLAIIQMTYKDRTEYYDHKWRQVSIVDTPLVNFLSDSPWEKRKKRLEKWGRYNHEFWKEYYTDIYSDTCASIYEEMFATTIRNHCKVNNVPLILMTQNHHTKVKFDLQLQNKSRYPQTNNGHPTEEGHRIIADDILRLV